MNKATVIGIAPRLFVADVHLTKNYYIHELGFELINEIEGIYAMVHRDGIQIHLAKSEAEVEERSPSELILWVPEIDLFFEELSKKQVRIIQEITFKKYGNREFVIEDIDKNKITIAD